MQQISVISSIILVVKFINHFTQFLLSLRAYYFYAEFEIGLFFIPLSKLTLKIFSEVTLLVALILPMIVIEMKI